MMTKPSRTPLETQYLPYQHYLEEYRRTIQGSNSAHTVDILAEYVGTPTGRELIAKSLLKAFGYRVERLNASTNKGEIRREARSLTLEIEHFIAILPDEERFTETVMGLRAVSHSIFNTWGPMLHT